jgi:predicted phosphodiesterase
MIYNNIYTSMKRIYIASVVILLMLNFHIRSDIIMSPYLQAVTVNSIYVLVECSTPDTVTINYGLTPSYGFTAKTEFIKSTDALPVTYIQEVKLIGLQSNTQYYYKAIQGSTQSEDRSFVTAVPPGTDFRFAWMADCRTGTAVHDQISQLIFAANPRFSLYGGDLCVSSSYVDWKNEFFRTPELTLISQVPFFNTPGNHEGWNQNTRAFTHSPVSASGTPDYYSFDYGDMHVLVLNNQIAYNQGSAQYVFAQLNLSSTTKQWKIVISHNPAYCSGGHGEDENMKILTEDIFEPNNVDMVISGHSHFYQHNLVNGIHHMVIGSAGATLYDPSNASYTLKSVKDYNYAIVDVTPVTFTMLVYNNVHALLDSIRLVKNAQGINIQNGAPLKYELYQNYPNPFNPVTTIKFDVALSPLYERGAGGFVSLKIYNLLGHEIATLMNKHLTPAGYELTWDASNYPSGVYFYKLIIGSYTQARKMVLLK